MLDTALIIAAPGVGDEEDAEPEPEPEPELPEPELIRLVCDENEDGVVEDGVTRDGPREDGFDADAEPDPLGSLGDSNVPVGLEPEPLEEATKLGTVTPADLQVSANAACAVC